MKNRKIVNLFGCMKMTQRLFFLVLLATLSIGVHGQTKTISGVVLDKTGESVIGASVIVKGTTNGTITDFDGNFSLHSVPSSGAVVVSFVGYKTAEVAVNNQTSLKVILNEDIETLDEVVVVGYGVQKKSDNS